MAITRVRVNLNGVWTTLAYNSSTGRYEGTLNVPGPSAGQSGGYYNVTAEATNASGVTASANGTSFPGLRLVVQDMTAPSLSVSAPADGLVTAAETVNVTGTVSDNVGVSSVTVNGAAASVSGNAFSASVRLSGGRNTITVTAKDAAGNQTTVTRTVTRATAGPSVAVTSPPDGLITPAAAVQVTGTVSDSVSPVAGVSVSGGAATVSGGTFSASIPLAEGGNTITVTAVNQVGLSTVKSLQVTRDSIAPVIAITEPATGQKFRTPSLTVKGTVSDSGSGIAGVTVNGLPAAVSGGSFAADITLAEGHNTISATAADRAGNTSTASVSVLLDTIPPALSVLSPAADLMTNQPLLTVMGTVSDTGSGLASLTVNGKSVQVTGQSFSYQEALEEGLNTIAVIAADEAGNTSTVTRSVLLDTVHPVITLTAPQEGFITTNRPGVSVVIQDEANGSGVDWSTLSVMLDGAVQDQEITVSGDTAIYTPAFALPDGPHSVTFSIRDRAGNLWSLSAAYLVDTVPPVLALAPVSSHRVVDVSVLQISGWVYDAGSPPVTVTAAGVSAAEKADGRFSLAVSLEIGVNPITVTARDRAGLETVQTFTVIRLVTDRTEKDVDKIAELCEKGYEEWTQAERLWWNTVPCLRGSYDWMDLNRVTAALEYIHSWLTGYGYADGYRREDHRPWAAEDAMTVPQAEKYLSNVRALRETLTVLEGVPQVPKSMEALTVDRANDIEAILVGVDRLRPLLDEAIIQSGEGSAGEF